MTKKISILGSTGSIGKNTLKVVDALKPEFEVFAITAHNNVELLAEQIKRFKPAYASITNGEHYDKLVELAGGEGVELLCGERSLVELACDERVDTVVTAVVGAAGLPAVLAGAKEGKDLAIANKEPLVIAGELLQKAARENGATILPIDSEHSAIFQALQAGSIDEVEQMILTGSGGPFRKASKEDLENVTLEQALAHPVWAMGPKITIDSATMMNKALEVIEARWLFGIEAEKIRVLIHPQSIVHSMVEFVDGSVVAQLGTPDMCLPIQYALTYPQRKEGACEHLDFKKLNTLSFEEPDFEKFPTLRIGFEIARTTGTAAVVFNAANEMAVELFLNGSIRFLNIFDLIQHCLDKHAVEKVESLEQLLEIDNWARREVNKCLTEKVW